MKKIYYKKFGGSVKRGGEDVLKIPKGERVWVQYFDSKSNLAFVLTSKEASRDFYFLYESAKDGLHRRGKAHSPMELEEKYRVADQLKNP